MVIEELEQFAQEFRADSPDWVIFACYRLVDACERAIRDEQTIRGVSRERLLQTLREIADRAFAIGWNSNKLSCI